MNIKRNIDFSKELDFVDYVVDKTFPVDEKGRYYVAGAKDFWFKVAIVEFFTDEDIIGECEADINKIADKLYEPNFINDIIKVVDKGQMKRIKANVDEMITFHKEKLIHDIGVKEFLKVFSATLENATKGVENAFSEMLPIKESDVVVEPE